MEKAITAGGTLQGNSTALYSQPFSYRAGDGTGIVLAPMLNFDGSGPTTATYKWRNIGGISTLYFNLRGTIAGLGSGGADNYIVITGFPAEATGSGQAGVLNLSSSFPTIAGPYFASIDGTNINIFLVNQTRLGAVAGAYILEGTITYIL